MSIDNQGNRGQQTVPIYTVYPVSGGYQGNVNFGFHNTYPQAPPPKYEDVVSGRIDEQRVSPQPSGAHDGLEPSGVVLVTPVYKYIKAQKTIGLIFTILFLVCFVSILVKVLSFC